MKLPDMPLFLRVFILALTFWALGCKGAKHSPVAHTVLIEQMKFKPASLTVEPGDSITWINNDLVAHNIVALPDSIWRSPLLQSGASWTLVAVKSSDYYCNIHVVMKGRIEVK